MVWTTTKLKKVSNFSLKKHIWEGQESDKRAVGFQANGSWLNLPNSLIFSKNKYNKVGKEGFF